MSLATPLSRPVLCGVCSVPCGIRCGIKPACLLGCAVCAVSMAQKSMQAGGRAHAHTCRRAHPRSRLHTAHTAHTAHVNTHAGLHVFAYRTTPPTHRTKKIMDCQNKKLVIVGTPDNAREMASAVKDWPELHDLVKGLQSQDLFPGLRGLRITITGDEQLLSQGLGAIKAINASKAV